jgi:hypothetical protein
MTRSLACIALGLLSLGVSLTGCGGKAGTISLKIVVSPADDPFGEAAQVKFTVGDGKTVKTSPVTAGKFNVTFDQKPMDKVADQVLVEALDAAGNTIAYGQTPHLSLAPADQGPYAVWVGRPGRMVPAATAMPTPRAEVAAANMVGLGVMFSGGRDAGGKVLRETGVYDVFTHTVIATSPMTVARAGAVSTSVGTLRVAVFGGSTVDGLGATGGANNTAEVFDPTTGLGLWSPLSGDVVDPRSFASATILPGGALIVTGGADDSGNPLATAALLSTDASPRLTVVATPMTTARRGHAIAAAKFPDGDGAILFGGLPNGSVGTVAERLIGLSFAAYDVGPEANRIGATATALNDGRVLVLGGRDATGLPLPSGIVINPTLPSAQITALPMAMSAPREGHTAIRVGNDVLVCGGLTAPGTLSATCDLLDGAAIGLIKETIPMGAGRRDHTATALENGLVIIASGLGADGAPLGSIEVYTPRR